MFEYLCLVVILLVLGFIVFCLVLFFVNFVYVDGLYLYCFDYLGSGIRYISGKFSDLFKWLVKGVVVDKVV